MTGRGYFMAICGSLIASLSVAGSASARAPVIKDQARLFQSETIQQANQEIKEINEQFHQKLVIETYPRIPKGLLTTLLKKKPDFGEWAKKHAGRSGLYVLICTEDKPADIRILARGDVQRAFPPELCQELQNQLRTALSTGQNDRGLLEIVSAMQRNLNDNFSPPAPFPWGGVFGVLIPILGVWLGVLVFRTTVLRAQSRSEGGPLPPDFAESASLPTAWFNALAHGRLRELFASRPVSSPPKQTSDTPASDTHASKPGPEGMAALSSTEAGADSFEP